MQCVAGHYGPHPVGQGAQEGLETGDLVGLLADDHLNKHQAADVITRGQDGFSVR